MNSPTAPRNPVRVLLIETDAAAYLALSPRTLQMWRRKGGGPEFVKLGSAVRYDREALDRYIADRIRLNTVA